jgi:hypothetical protein
MAGAIYQGLVFVPDRVYEDYANGCFNGNKCRHYNIVVCHSPMASDTNVRGAVDTSPWGNLAGLRCNDAI